jgi:hypothetical protein
MKKMNPRVKRVKADSDYTLLLSFDNGEKKVFDVKPYLNFGVFSQLKDLKIFNSVRPFFGSICWSNNVDIDPDTLYIDSKKISTPHKKGSLPKAAEPLAKYKKRKKKSH